MTTRLFQLYNTKGKCDSAPRATAVTIGVFDGVHRGHQSLIAQLAAQRDTLVPLVVTLTSHPSFVLGRRESEYWLDDSDEHIQLLFDAGAEYVAVMPFTTDVAQLTACQTARLMHEQLGMQTLLLGYDGRFGNRQHDDFAQLPQLADELNFHLAQGAPFNVDGRPISSSRIRETLEQGAVENTATLLGRAYTLRGTVRHGRGVGHTLGFPTANIDLSATRKMLPREGVYAVRLGRWRGMANLGTAPTFAVDKPLLEVHLLDFDGDLYGQQVKVHFLRHLRDIVRFESSEALQQQLQKDLNICRQL